MAKDKTQADATTVEGIRAMAEGGNVKIEGDPPRQWVSVRALVNVKAGGMLHAPGCVFGMEISLAAAHVKAGQVELAASTGSGQAPAGQAKPAGAGEDK